MPVVFVKISKPQACPQLAAYLRLQGVAKFDGGICAKILFPFLCQKATDARERD